MALARHSAYYLTGRLASAAVGMLALYAFTRVLSPADYGRYSVIVTMAGLVSGFGFQWLRQCLVKFGPDPTCDRSELLGSVGSLFLSLIATAVAVAIIVAVFSNGRGGAISKSLIAVTVALALAQAWFELGLDANRVDMNPVRYGVAGLLRAAFCLTFGLLAQWLTHTLAAVILGVALGYMVASLLAAPRWLGGLASIRKASWAQTKTLAAYGLPLALTLGFTFIVDSADRLMLAAMSGATEAGIYSSAYNLGQYALGNLLAGLGLAVFPLAVKRYAEHGADRTGTLLGENLLLLVGLALPATLGLVVLAPTLTRLLLGNFVPGQSALITAIVAVGVAFAAIRSYAYDIVFMLAQKTKQQAAVLAVAAGVNILLNWVFIPRWGAAGAASATLLAFFLALCLSMILGRRLIEIRIRPGELIKIMVGSAIMVAMLIGFAVHNTWLSLVLRITLGGVVYLCAMLILNPLDIRPKLHEWFRRKIA
ncbi:MAG: oligosaccharide flippase family protein [Casimicrobiaceae bacterium]